MKLPIPILGKPKGRFVAICLMALALAACMTLAGCGPGMARTLPPAASSTGFSGTVEGAGQPISGALIQLYAVGSTGDGSPASPLIPTTVTTSDGTGAANSNANAGNANNSLPAGAFTVPGTYACPSQTSWVYLIATGGNPGIGSGTNNQQIALVTVLGRCGSISSGTQVAVNELTTIGSIAPLFRFMNSVSALGYGASDASQFAAALAEVAEYTDSSAGTVPGSSLPSGYYASTQLLETLGDILASCIHSTGGTAGDATACGQLFKLTTPQGGSASTDTAQAVINILKNPTVNVSSIYGLVTPGAPFQPVVPVAPASWTMSIMPLPTTFGMGLNNTSMFVGASIVYYWPLPVHKDGIPGQTSSEVLARFSSDVLNHGYSRVMILCGTNDILQGTPNVGTELTGNLEGMAEMATKARIEVVLSQLPPLTGTYANLDSQVVAANAAIAQLATQHHYLVVDYYKPLKGHPEYLPDGIHPNSAGYALMEQALSSVVLY